MCTPMCHLGGGFFFFFFFFGGGGGGGAGGGGGGGRSHSNAIDYLQNPQNRHPISRPGRGLGCILWFLNLIYVLLLSLHGYMRHHDILHCVITVLDCIWSQWCFASVQVSSIYVSLYKWYICKKRWQYCTDKQIYCTCTNAVWNWTNEPLNVRSH